MLQLLYSQKVRPTDAKGVTKADSIVCVKVVAPVYGVNHGHGVDSCAMPDMAETAKGAAGQLKVPIDLRA